MVTQEIFLKNIRNIIQWHSWNIVYITWKCWTKMFLQQLYDKYKPPEEWITCSNKPSLANEIIGSYSDAYSKLSGNTSVAIFQIIIEWGNFCVVSLTLTGCTDTSWLNTYFWERWRSSKQSEEKSIVEVCLHLVSSWITLSHCDNYHKFF